MKCKIVIIIIILFTLMMLSSNSSAQQPPQQSLDQEIESLEKKLAELKQRKREALLKQIKALQDDLDKIEQTQSVANPSSTTSPQKNVNISSQPPTAIETILTPSRASSRQSLPQSDIGVEGVNPTMSAPGGVTQPSWPAINNTNETATAATTNSGARGTASNQTGNKCFSVNLEPSKHSRSDVAICALARLIAEDSAHKIDLSEKRRAI